MSDVIWSQRVDDAIEALDDPTIEEAHALALKYPNHSVLAALIRRGAGGGIGRQATVELTDAQVKALPSAPVEVVPDPGAGKVIVPVLGVASLEWHGDYSAIAASALITLLPTGGVGFSDALAESDGGGVSALLAVGQAAIATFTLQQTIAAAITRASGGYDPTSAGGALRFWATNGGSDFGGGDPANTLRVAVAYHVLDLADGTFS